MGIRQQPGLSAFGAGMMFFFAIAGANAENIAGPAKTIHAAQQAASPVAAEETGGGRPGASALGRYPERVYVPNTIANTVQVIDPKRYKITATYSVGKQPNHVTPSWDLTKLYVNNTGSDSLTVIDPLTGKITGEIPVTDPYNLYFTPDGTKAIVVAERHKRLDFRDPHTWKLLKSVPVPWAGVDHAAFTRDRAFLVASCEFSGYIVKVDLNTLEVVANMKIGDKPIDVLRPPGQNLMFVADQALHGVHVIDPDAWKALPFIPTGRGAHGILLSHDKSSLYVSNRLEGTISVIDVAARKVVAKWKTGESPDMGQLSPDGKQLWISNRYHKHVAAIDTTSGKVIAVIETDAGPHGLTYFPNSTSAHSVGHNGVYLED
jgi:YVTN family beta-propeller protein